MADNSAMKRALIMQSFAPLFLILLIKYFDIKLFGLCERFGKIILKNPILALSKAVSHSIFVTLESLMLCFIIHLVIFCTYNISNNTFHLGGLGRMNTETMKRVRHELMKYIMYVHSFEMIS